MAVSTEHRSWLHDEPQPKMPAAMARRPGAMWPWYLLLLLLIAAVAAVAWWLNTAKEAAPPVLPAEQSIPIESEAAVEPVTAQPLSVVGEDTEPEPQQVAAPTAATAPQLTQRQTRQPRPAHSFDDRAATSRSVASADDAVTSSLASGSVPVAVSNSRPYSGRVIQLGAFPTRAQAETSWRRITRRYPYLATKSKMLNTVYVGGLGGGPPTRMYRLQLGTSSQAQSVVICQQLERAGHSCVVVY